MSEYKCLGQQTLLSQLRDTLSQLRDILSELRDILPQLGDILSQLCDRVINIMYVLYTAHQ